MRGANPIRTQEHGDGLSLWVQEVFYTLQGEGPFSGQPSVFVRLAGCNLRCHFCDTDFESSSWTPTLDELMNKVADLRPEFCDLIVITGGEPLRQNIVPFIKQLLDLGLRVQIETNGTLWLDLPINDRLFIVCSPKTALLNQQIVPRINAYKYVLAHGEISSQDGLPACSSQQKGMIGLIARPHSGPEVIVMPMDSGNIETNQQNVQATVESALSFGYRFNLQTHKVIGVQ